MTRLLKRIGTVLSSQAIALLALCIVVSGGTAYAVAAKNSVVSRSIKDGQVKTRDLAERSVNRPRIAAGAVDSRRVVDQSLTGADIDEDSLTRVPSALAADLGGLVWSSPEGSCTPPSTASYTRCVEMTVSVPAAGRLVLIGHVGISHRNDNQYQAAGMCRFRVDDHPGPDTRVAKSAGALATGWDEMATLLHTAPVDAGSVTVGIWCRDSYYSKFGNVRLVALAAAPTT